MTGAAEKNRTPEAQLARGDWLAATGRAIDALGGDEFPERLIDLVGQAAAIDTAVILGYRRNDIPVILFDRLHPDERRHFYESYVSGVYLASPFYQAVLRGGPVGFCTLRDLAPEGFAQSEYHRTYYRHIGTADLAGFLVPCGADLTLLLSLGRRFDRPRFGRADLRRLRAVEPVVTALAARRWGDLGTPASHEASTTRSLHSAFQARFEAFGQPLLTPRESEVVRLLLRGYSAKAAARALGIAPETLRVHRKHIYAKLGVSSQGELFSVFITSFATAETGG